MRERFGGVELCEEGGVGFGEPFGAFLCGAAEFTVLSEEGLLESVVDCGGGVVVGDEESYLLLEGGSRRRSRRRPWEGGHLTSRPWL